AFEQNNAELLKFLHDRGDTSDDRSPDDKYRISELRASDLVEKELDLDDRALVRATNFSGNSIDRESADIAKTIRERLEKELGDGYQITFFFDTEHNRRDLILDLLDKRIIPNPQQMNPRI